MWSRHSSADRTDQTFHERVLPGRAQRTQDFLDAHACEAVAKGAVDAVAAACSANGVTSRQRGKGDASMSLGSGPDDRKIACVIAMASALILMGDGCGGRAVGATGSGEVG